MSKEDTILLHICCAPCGSASIERLLSDFKKVILFFSNSNINSKKEFDKRFNSVKKLSEIYNTPYYLDNYDHLSWQSLVRGFESEVEKGRRCGICFNYSLFRTSLTAKSLNLANFTTTLTISPHKISKNIFEKGGNYPGFIAFDFKKKDGFKKSIELSEKYNLYRQNYCGCEFSIKG